MKKLLLLLLLGLPAYSDQVSVTNFSGGINNNNNPATIGQDTAQDLLNVDITPGGLSVKKRSGYGLYKALSTAQPMKGGFHAFDSTGNDYQIWGSSRSLYGIVADATPTQLVSSATLNSTWDCADTQGFAYCVNSNRDALIRTNGATMTWYSSPLGTMVETTPDRIVIGGVSGAPNTLYFSQSNTFTNFVTGVNDTDAFTEVIASQGSKLTHIRWACGKLLWWKDQSFGYFDFDNQYAAQVKTVSDTIGTFDNTSAVDPGGSVWFRGQDGHTWKYDCSSLSKESVDITPNVQASGSRTSNLWTQTTQTDFQAGGVTFNGPSPSVSTTAVAGSVVPTTYTLTDTSSADFGSFTSISVGIDTSTVSGAVTLKTYMADTFSNFNNWTDERCQGGACPGTMSASGGAMTCSGSCSAVSTMTVLGDFLLQVKAISANTGEIAALNSSYQGYGIRFDTTGTFIGVRKFTNWFDKSSGSSPLFSGGVAATANDVFTLRRDSASTGLFFYKNGVFLSSATDASYSSFTNVRIYLAGTGNSVDDVYNVASYGNFNSRAIDTQFVTPVFGALSATGSGNGTYSYATKTSVASGSGFDAGTAVSSGAIVTSASKRYVVYSATITAGGSASNLPQLQDVSILTASSGTYYSAVKNAPNLTAWSTFGAGTALNDGTETFYMRSSTSSFSVLSSTPSWTAQTNGGLITIATGTYFQVRDDFAITAATQTPTLNDFTVNWFEGSATDQAYILYFDNAIWQSVAFGSGQSTNNYIFKKDLINDAWTLYNFGVGGMLTQANRLYFGSTSLGNIFSYGTTTSDNGTAIQSYWKSKEFAGPDPFLQNQLTNIDTFAKKDQGSTLTATYTVETSTSTSFSIALSSTTQTLIQSRKLLPSGKLGYTFSMQYGDTSTSSAWEILGFRIGFVQQPYRPSN